MKGVSVPARSGLIDVCKAVGIVLVVWGHSPGIPDLVGDLLYSFHMPLFFFISGYLLKTERLEQGLASQARELARSLLRPYVLFFVISLGYWVATRNIGTRAGKFGDLTVLDALFSMVTGLSADLFVNMALWFFPCMFVTQLLYRMAWKLVRSDGWLALGSGVIAAVLMATTLPWSTRLPWGLDIAWVALVFFSAGRCARPGSALVQCAVTRPGWVRLPILLAVLLVWLGCASSQGRVDLALANFGPSWPIYFVAAFSGIAVLFTVASRLRATLIVQWLAHNTLIIFPLHALFINLGSGLAKMLGAGHYGQLASLLFALWAIVCTVPAAFLLKRYFAPLLGMPATRQRAAA
ncbi:acyltransferase family protein [Pseudorhodoferax sp. LjRoot39]|uniref:acyltransferase family protein n=1 Tax=Pseudorhodoferax sp. LjRoot39 TaxID=3342328 RepID=UPI003ED166E6